MKVLVCGGRNLAPGEVWSWLESHSHHDASDALSRSSTAKISTIIHGRASGADKGGADWGESEGIRVIAYRANWRKYGKAAGPIRNAQMLLEGKPDLVIAFPGGRGTADMVRQAHEHGVPVVFPAEAGFSPLPTMEAAR